MSTSIVTDLEVEQFQLPNFPANVNKSEEKFFSLVHQQEGLEIVQRWADIFPREKNHVNKISGQPSLLVRLDCVPTEAGLVVFEVEERPAGAGMCCHLNSQFQANLSQVKKNWPVFTFLVCSPSREENQELYRCDIDDALWLKPYAGSGPVLVRSHPGYKPAHQYVSNAMGSITMEGDKSYGVELGLWRIIFHPDELDWKSNFVLKPVQGTHCKNVMIFCADSQLKKQSGATTRSKIERDFDQNNGMYCQSFVPPMRSGYENYPFMIYRVYYGYDLDEGQWKCLGGAANVCTSMRVHGGSNAAFLPLMLK